MNLKILSTKKLDFSDIVGKMVALNLNANRVNTIVIHMNKDSIYLKSKCLEGLKKGDNIQIEVLYKNNILNIIGKVKSYEDNILHLRLPKKIEAIQQRDYLRVECNAKCYLDKIEDNVIYNGHLENISASGALIMLDNKIDYEILKDKIFQIIFSIKDIQYKLDCTCISINGLEIRLKFIDLDEYTEECLIKYCFEKDAALFREKISDDR